MKGNGANSWPVPYWAVLVGCGLVLSPPVDWGCFGADPTTAAKSGFDSRAAASGGSSQANHDEGLRAAARGDWQAACVHFQEALDLRLSESGASSAAVWDSRFQLAVTLKRLNADSDAEQHLIELVQNRPEFLRRTVPERLAVINLLAEVRPTDRGLILLEDVCYHVIDSLVECEAGRGYKIHQLLQLANVTQQCHTFYVAQYCYSASLGLLDSAPNEPELVAKVNARFACYLAEIHKFRSARQCVDRALEIKAISAADTSVAHYALGRIHFFEGDYEKANRQLEAAANLISKDAELTSHGSKAEIDLCLSWLVLGENEKTRQRLESFSDRFLSSSLTSEWSHLVRLKLLIILQLACDGKNTEAGENLEHLMRDLLGVSFVGRVPTYFDNPACIWSTLAVGFSRINDSIATRFCLEQRVRRFASAADGDSARFEVWLSQVHAETGNRRPAIESANNAVSIVRNTEPQKVPELLRWCGECYAALEEYGTAKRVMERAAALSAEVPNPEDQDKIVYWQLAEAHVRFVLGEYRRAEAMCRSVLESLEMSGDRRELLVDCYTLLGRILRQVAEPEPAAHYLLLAMRLLETPSIEYERPRKLEFLQAEYGLALLAQGKKDLARTTLTVAVKESRKHGGEFDDFAAYAERSLAILELNERNLEAAEQCLLRSLKGENGFEATETQQLLAICVLAKGETDRAVALLNDSLADTEAKLGRSHPLVASCLHGLAQAAAAKGNQDAAQQYVLEALRIRRQFFGDTNPLVAQTAALAKQVGCDIPPTLRR